VIFLVVPGFLLGVDVDTIESFKVNPYLYGKDIEIIKKTDLLQDKIIYGDFLKYKSPARIYFYITIHNKNHKNKKIYIKSLFNFQKLTLYRFDEKRTKVGSSMGYGESVKQRDSQISSFLVSLQPGKNIFIGDLELNFPLVPQFTLHSEEEYKRLVGSENIFIVILFTIFSVMVLYNFFIFIFVRKIYYFLYTAYLLTAILLNMCYLGVGYWILGNLSSLVTSFWAQWVIINVLAGWFFGISFLRLRKDHPLLYKIGLWIGMVIILFFLYAFVNPIQSLTIFNFTIGSVAFIAMPMGIYRFIKGYRPALYYTIAWGILSLGAIIFNLSITGIFPKTTFTLWSYFYASAAEMILLSLALGNLLRFNELKMLKSQRDYIGQLETEKKEKAHVYGQLEKIVYTHQISKIQKGAVLEETMPVGKGWAGVIALDIVNSSQLSHDVANAFFREYFLECEKLIMDGYDEEQMISAAYRIKEMGDGFLCSIGYPFKNEDSVSLEAAAFNLSVKFFRLFNEVAEKQNLTGKIFCAIGIALGEIEGFYPVAGTKEYDLYGKGIILATRYEALRKVIFASEKSNILTLQQNVYEALPERLKERFIQYQLNDHPIAEDAENLIAWYTLVD